MALQEIIVSPGESLSTLALRVYGDETLWREVGDVLDRSVFDPLRAGEKLSLPSTHELKEIASGAVQRAAQQELAKRFPGLDLSSLKSNSTQPYQLLEWIL